MTQEEKMKIEEKAMEEERKREALREKEPAFNLYMVMDDRLNKDFGDKNYLSQIVSRAYENDCVGDEAQRWAEL